MKIAGLIGSYLNIIQYHHYRLSSVNSLGEIPKLMFSAYKESCGLLCTRDPSVYMMLLHTTPEAFIYIVMNQHTRQIIRSKSKIPLSLKLTIFNYFVEPVALYSILIDILKESRTQNVYINYKILFDKMIDFGDVLIINLLLRDDRFEPTFEHMKRALHQLNTSVVHLLINDGRIDVTLENDYLFRTSCCIGMATVVDGLLKYTLVDACAVKNEGLRRYSTLAIGAIMVVFTNIAVVELLLEDGRIDPTTADYLAVFLAYSNQKYSIVGLLLNDSRIDPVKVFEMAMINNQMGIADYLVKEEYIVKKLTRKWFCL
ncbi:hypothetical protein HDV04_002010 [Boothiomyces sp. JEL0838]|nr:hypothetical protein HDV04_002010 [Boothiomyces sp. JEL0838]